MKHKGFQRVQKILCFLWQDPEPVFGGGKQYEAGGWPGWAGCLAGVRGMETARKGEEMRFQSYRQGDGSEQVSPYTKKVFSLFLNKGLFLPPMHMSFVRGWNILLN